jgi:hypothetical protein
MAQSSTPSTFTCSAPKRGARLMRSSKASGPNGQVEGQISRLKLLKRQTYGRASFTLLKQKVLYAA